MRNSTFCLVLHLISIALMVVIAIKLHIIMSRQRENGETLKFLWDEQCRIRNSVAVQQIDLKDVSRSITPTTQKIDKVSEKYDKLESKVLETNRLIDQKARLTAPLI